MKKAWTILLASALLLSGCAGNSHTHAFVNEKRADEFLAVEQTCQNRAQYYYSCDCGAHGEETFEYGGLKGHSYTAKTVSADRLRYEANCSREAEYYYSCATCGVRGYTTFKHGEIDADNHDFSKKNTDAKYLKSEPTKEKAAEYYYSCTYCDEKSEEFFSYGDPLRTYTDAEKEDFKPNSLTVSLYDASSCTYGFTYNTVQRPLRPVLQIAKGSELGTDFVEYDGTVSEFTAYNANEKSITLYVVKVEADLDENTEYTYRAYDKYVEAAGEVATLTTVAPSTNESFKFAHVSDSQVQNGGVTGGSFFGKVVDRIIANGSDFIVHTGDFVQYAKLESEWDAMVHANFNYLSKIPVMAAAGNHDVGGYGNSSATHRHFHYKMPEQSTTSGVYYSFEYGNVKFIVLNTNDMSGNRINSAQLSWLKAELQNNECDWTVVAMHKPLYSVGSWGSDTSRNQDTLGLRSQLQKLFYDNGVDIVLQGHDHNISKTKFLNGTGAVDYDVQTQTIDGVVYSISPDGVTYLMNGPAGDQDRGPYLTEIPTIYEYGMRSYERSWAEFTVDGNKLTVEVKYHRSGEDVSYGKWGIIKN